MNLKQTLNRRIKSSGSRVILALDNPLSRKATIDEDHMEHLFERSSRLAMELSPRLCGIKIGYPLVIPLGIQRIGELIRTIRQNQSDLLFIADLKLSDIDSTNESIAGYVFEVGFDAVIFHLFVGSEGGYDALLRRARAMDRAAIGLPFMSHEGADRHFEGIYKALVEDALAEDVPALVVPATRLDILREIRQLVGNRCILLATGVGAQGGRGGLAIEAGADVLIVGRSLYTACDPLKALNGLLSSFD